MRTQHKACILIWRENRCVLFCFGVSCRNSTNAEVVMGVGSRLCRYSLFPPRWGQLLSYTCQKSSYNSKKTKREDKIRNLMEYYPSGSQCERMGVVPVCALRLLHPICLCWGILKTDLPILIHNLSKGFGSEYVCFVLEPILLSERKTTCVLS